MRKLSKKISMLMVLAMLVSLFSGIVSASAASSWSFYDRTAEKTVERNDTYVMEKDQYANFDLYKDGAEASTKEYKYTWYSDDASVVYVDSTNGRLRAQKDAEAGEKAFIYVLIDNKSTEKNENAKRGFTIVIADDADYAIVADFADEVVAVGEKLALAATVTVDGEAVEATVDFTLDGAAITEFVATEAGDYTIVATATVDGEVVTTEKFVVVAEANAPVIVDAQQTALKAVELTFNDAAWAKKVVEDNALIQLSYIVDEFEVSDYIKGVAAKEGADDTVVVSLYNDMAKDTTYKFAYAGYDCSATVVGVDAVAAEIKVVGGSVGAGEDGDLKIKVFTANGIDITDKGFTEVTYSVPESGECDVNGDKIFFFEAGKSVVVTAKLEMGYDDDGNELEDLEAKGVYRSVAAYEFSNPQKFAISTETAKDKIEGLTYGTTVNTMSTDDEALEYYLYASYTRSKADGTTSTQYIVNGEAPWDEQNGEASFTYYSSNESVLFVDEVSGLLDPVNNGTASIFIKDKDEKVVASVRVTVEGARKLDKFTASITDKMLSVNDGNTVGDKIEIAVSAKDQLGADITPTYKVEVVNNENVAIDDIFDVTATDGVATVTATDGKITLMPADTAYSVTGIADKGDTLKVRIKLTATKGDVTKAPELQFTMKYVDVTGSSDDVLTLSKSNVDMKLNQKAESDYNVDVTIAAKDNKGFDLGNKEFIVMDAKTLDDDAKAVAVTGDYYILVLDKDDKVVTDKFDVADTDDKITFAPVFEADDLTKKMDKANYTIKLYKWTGSKLQYKVTKTLSLTDSTSAVTAKVTATTLETGYDKDDLLAAIEFYRDGNKINDKITNVAVADSIPTTDGAKEYIKKLTLTISNSELNGEFAGEHTEEITLNQLFVIE